MLTYNEIKEKYGINEAYISMAVTRSGIKPKGSRPIGRRMIALWDETEVVPAVAKIFLERSGKHIEKANQWSDAASRLLKEVEHA